MCSFNSKTQNKEQSKNKNGRSKTRFPPQAAFFLHGYFPNADLMEGGPSLPALGCGYSVWSVKNKF